jgi:3-oxoacyl-[acyl-carrier protein] reductase/7-alpha-hydroxysteroid dehydrogenase
MGRLDNRIAIITGGSRGIGYATAQAFLKEGAIVIITASNEENAKKAKESLKNEFSHCLYILLK